MTESFEPVARRRRALSLRAVVVGVVMVVASAGLGYMAVTGRGLVVTREPVVVQVIAGVIALAPLAAAGRVVTTVRRVRVARRVQIGGAGIRLVEGARMPVDVPWAELADVVVVRSYTTAGQCDERLHLVLRPDSPLARTLPAWRAGTGRHRAFPVPGFPVAKLRAAIDRVPSAGRLAGVGRQPARSFALRASWRDAFWQSVPGLPAAALELLILVLLAVVVWSQREGSVGPTLGGGLLFAAVLGHVVLTVVRLVRAASGGVRCDGRVLEVLRPGGAIVPVHRISSLAIAPPRPAGRWFAWPLSGQPLRLLLRLDAGDDRVHVVPVPGLDPAALAAVLEGAPAPPRPGTVRVAGRGGERRVAGRSGPARCRGRGPGRAASNAGSSARVNAGSPGQRERRVVGGG